MSIKKRIFLIGIAALGLIMARESFASKPILPVGPPPQCSIVDVGLSAPWWTFGAAEAINTIFHLPAATFSGAPTDCWSGITDFPFVSPTFDFPQGYIFPAPLGHDTQRVYASYPLDGGVFELAFSFDNGFRYHHYLTIKIAPCHLLNADGSNRKYNWFYIEFPAFSRCDTAYVILYQVFESD